jgi:hypothetical protein
MIWSLRSSIAICALVCGHTVSAQPTPSTTIGIKVKLFDADRPSRAVTPLMAYGYYRPGEGIEAQFLDNLIFEKQENGFYLVTVPRGILLERLVIDVQEPGYNEAVLTKIVTANDMIVYPGASDSGGIFNFQGYKNQMATYAALYSELVEDLRLVTPEHIRALYGSQILAMPAADDLARLPGLDSRQRAFARELRRDVLQQYGFLPAEKRAVHVAGCAPVRRYCVPLRRGCCMVRWCRR